MLFAGWVVKRWRKQLADPRSWPCSATWQNMANPRGLAPGLPSTERGPLPTRILGRTGAIRKDPAESRKKSVSTTGKRRQRGGWSGAGGRPASQGPPNVGARRTVHPSSDSLNSASIFFLTTFFIFTICFVFVFVFRIAFTWLKSQKFF